MNILHVITGLPKASGVTTFVENVVREQRALGHTVEVLTNANVHQLTTNPQPLTPNPSLIHIHGLWSPLLHKAARFARKNKIPVVWSTHGMSAPWSLHHKWWKKCLPWYLYQLPDLRSAALIHCTTDLEADWNRSLGFKNVFIAPLGTTLPEGRACGPSRAAIDAPTNDALARDFDRRAMAEKNVAEWLVGVDDETFDAALQHLVEEKTASGEYRFSRAEDRELAMQGARRFFADFASKIVSLSDGRCVYFVPDPRAVKRNASNALSWAEYAFHAVSAGGAKVPGANYNERWFNPHKVHNLRYLEEALRAERCFVRLSKVDCRYDSVMFAGESHDGESVQVVTRLDEMGNMDANLSEVTFNAARRQQKKLPRLVPLTEAVRTVVHHQNTAGSYPQDENNIANPSSPRKGADNNSTVQPSTFSLQPRTLLYVGRIYPVKALDNAIRAVALMKHPITLRLVGPDQSGHMSELMSLCDSLHLPCTKPGEENSAVHLHLSPSPLVQFIGPKYDAELSAEYDACDALILVSHTENFGATVIDAMAHGKPVITSTNTPWKIVADKGCGYWVDNNPESLAKTFDTFASSSTSSLNLMGANGLALVKQSYTWPAIARNLISHYEKV